MLLYILLFLCSSALSSMVPSCLQADYITKKGIKDDLKLQPVSGSCSCFVKVKCRQFRNSECAVLSTVKFGCEKKMGTNSYNNGNLKLFFNGTMHKVIYNALQNLLFNALSSRDSIVKPIHLLKNTTESDQIYSVWDALIYSLSQKHRGGTGRVISENSKHIWLPLTLSFVLLLFTSVVFIYFT